MVRICTVNNGFKHGHVQWLGQMSPIHAILISHCLDSSPSLCLYVCLVSLCRVPEQQVSVLGEELDGLHTLGVARVLVHALLGDEALVVPVVRPQA